MADFSLIITAIDETWSLKKTVETVLADNRDTVADIIIATAPHTTAACRAVVREMEATYPSIVREHEQCRLRGVGGANIECAELATTEWVLIMASDLETPPEKVQAIIARAEVGDVDVVATSRWLRGGNFGDYARVKLLCNWIFQKMYSLLYFTHLTDMTYGYRAYRRNLFSRYHWQETGHAFFMESICKFLRSGIRIAEIPMHWQRRQEGMSHIQTAEFLRYFRVGLSVRFARKSSFIISTKETP